MMIWDKGVPGPTAGDWRFFYKLREGNIRIPSGCAISGIFSKTGIRIAGSRIIDSIAVMHDRSNGLGGGFAGYGIYPEYKDLFALHVFFESNESREETERFINSHFDVVNLSRIPVRTNPNIVDVPLIWRYFVSPLHSKLEENQLDEKEYVVRCVFNINTKIDGAYVFSSGKNMGVFKAVGYPEDVGDFYRLEEYSAYCWTAHGRYPTNTPGWWGGAHPFSLLDFTIVHNGEISSYDANRRFVEMFGYKCSLLTDTEVITYIFDLLSRKHGMSLTDIASTIAAPFWSDIEKMCPADREKFTAIRNVYSSLLITGPFSIILGFEGGMMALNDRLKLRSMVAAEKGDFVMAASEECAIRAIFPEVDRMWSPKGGEPVIARLKGDTD
jgi:glutamate synthase domain-containing protein 1